MYFWNKQLTYLLTIIWRKNKCICRVPDGGKNLHITCTYKMRYRLAELVG